MAHLSDATSRPDHSATPDLERRTMRKVTWRLMPFLIALYFVNYLDRTNIGFAGPNGLNDELGLTATMFGLASGVFFIGYLLLEVPSNLALHKFGGRRWLARIIFSWGIVASLMAFVPNATWLYIARFFLGVAEAGFFPGIILYLTYWFPKRERAKATALFLLAIPLSTVIGARSRPGSSALETVTSARCPAGGSCSWPRVCRRSRSASSAGSTSPTARSRRRGSATRNAPGSSTKWITSTDRPPSATTTRSSAR